MPRIPHERSRRRNVSVEKLPCITSAKSSNPSSPLRPAALASSLAMTSKSTSTPSDGTASALVACTQRAATIRTSGASGCAPSSPRGQPSASAAATSRETCAAASSSDLVFDGRRCSRSENAMGGRRAPKPRSCASSSASRFRRAPGCKSSGPWPTKAPRTTHSSAMSEGSRLSSGSCTVTLSIVQPSPIARICSAAPPAIACTSAVATEVRLELGST
mmetsp:Transcript_136710/g.323890  ORF Transcript_136710/g.323890 Transcript_136710/m.323890 type:complete len:218 (+) Transcript_136710:191-844(+)